MDVSNITEMHVRDEDQIGVEMQVMCIHCMSVILLRWISEIHLSACHVNGVLTCMSVILLRCILVHD